MNSNKDETLEKNTNEENLNSEKIQTDEKLIDTEEIYKFGWGNYSEITNGRFAMLGFLAIILIELFSHQSFLKWAGIM